MGGILVQRVDNPVSEPVKVGVSVSQSQHFFDERVSAFHRTIGNSYVSVGRKGIDDLVFPVRKSRSEIFKLFNIRDPEIIDYFNKSVLSIIKISEGRVVEFSVQMIKLMSFV